MPTTRTTASNHISLLSEFYYLAKPGIIRANVMTAIAGFLFAANGDIDWFALACVVVGIAGLIGGACVLNNMIDVSIDSKMKRTKTRALVTGAVSRTQAFVFAAVLLIVGLVFVSLASNTLTALLGIVAVFWYVVVYGYAKRKTHFSTLIGTVPGALPLVAGYTSVTGQLDVAALVLFLIMVTWQMPHFYAIAIYRIDDYRAARLPIVSIAKGIDRTKKEMLVYTFLFLLVTPLLPFAAPTSWVYTVGALTAGVVWLAIELKDYNSKDDSRWAKQVFATSLVVLLSISLLLSFNFVLP